MSYTVNCIQHILMMEFFALSSRAVVEVHVMRLEGHGFESEPSWCTVTVDKLFTLKYLWERQWETILLHANTGGKKAEN